MNDLYLEFLAFVDACDLSGARRDARKAAVLECGGKRSATPPSFVAVADGGPSNDLRGVASPFRVDLPFAPKGKRRRRGGQGRALPAHSTCRRVA